MFTFIEKEILKFATDAHASIDQRRKYTNEPYIVHPIRVAETVKKFGGSGNQICAALLHDVLEDVPEYKHDHEKFKKIIRDIVGDSTDYDAEEIIEITLDLTDEYDKESYPDLNRKERKRLESLKKSKMPGKSKSVKLCDVIDNTSDIAQNDKGFAVTYLRELEVIMDGLKNPDIPELYNIAEAELKKANDIVKRYTHALSYCKHLIDVANKLKLNQKEAIYNELIDMKKSIYDNSPEMNREVLINLKNRLDSISKNINIDVNIKSYYIQKG